MSLVKMKSLGIKIIDADITTLQVDAIVNAANSALGGGGGVDGAIHRAAGPELAKECREFGYCPTGEAIITKGYNLPAKFVIHTVGPIWHGGDRHEHELLASCYKRSLELAIENKIGSIAFPAISCGAYRFPIEEAAQTAISTIKKFCSTHDNCPSQIYLVCFDPKVKRAYEKHLEALG